MIWQKVDNYHFKSGEGYIVAAFVVAEVNIFRAFKPDGKSIGSTYKKCSLAKKACEKYQDGKN